MASHDASVRPARILVVDDESSVRDILKDFLEFEGFEVVLATNGAEGLAVVLSESIDLVLTDLEMPEMSGLEFLRELSGVTRAPSAIMMTGYGTVESAIEAMKVGAYDYILKPFQIEELLHLVRKALDHRRLAEENIHLQELVQLYQVSESLNHARSSGDVARHLCHALEQVLEPDWLAVWRFEDGRWDELVTWVARREPALMPVKIAGVRAVPLLKAFNEDGGMVLAAAQFTDVFQVAGEPPASTVVVPLRASGRINGFVAAMRQDAVRAYTEGYRKTLSLYADRAAASLENLRLVENLEQTFLQTIESLASALEARDVYTKGHSERVAQWAMILGELMELDRDAMEDLRRGALLHDIGKIGVNMEALNRPGELTSEEVREFRMHTLIGKRILEPIAFLKGAIPGVVHHHERWDGGGYPLGLKGEEIPLAARILAIADSFEVMITDRVYRKAMSLDAARAELKRCAGTQFDPEIVARFLAWLEPFADVEDLPVKGGRFSGGEPARATGTDA